MPTRADPFPGGGSIAVPVDVAGGRLDAAVRGMFGLSWAKAREAIRTGKVFGGTPPTAWLDEGSIVREGDRLEIRASAPRPHVARREAIERFSIALVDASVVVAVKPSGISTIPYLDEDPRTTFDALVRDILIRRMGARGRAPLGVVHRIDKETSGLVVFARTVAAKQHLAAQFRVHSVHRRYVAIVHGALTQPRTCRSYLVEDRGDGLRGSARPGQRQGKLAITHVEPLEQLAGATLVACQLETGRTHQIRIHLSEAGHPLVGERVYVRRFEGTPIPAPRLMLHALELGFEHPQTGEQVRFTEEPPADFEKAVAELRRA